MLNKTVWFSLILSLTPLAPARERVQPNPTTTGVEAVSPQASQACPTVPSAVSPKDMPAGRQWAIQADRARKLEAAREHQKNRRHRDQ